MPISELSSQDLRKALGHFATGVAVVTARGADGAPVGVTINSFSSVSLSPPLVLFSLDRGLRSLASFHASETFGISILADDQRDICHQFASKGVDKWHNISTIHKDDESPLLADAILHLKCTRHTELDGGDHVIFLVRVVEAVTARDAEPLLFWRGRFVDAAARETI